MKIKKIWYFHGIIFLAAFLLFQIELIISKIFLLEFGGSYAVWGAALVFFQGTLFLGYLYSHFVVQKFGISRYRYFHLLLFVLTLFFFPGTPLPVIHSQVDIPIVINVFLQLARSIGLVFFILSTASIIYQSWLAESELPERANPYVLYAVSNLGSFAGLLSYPFIFETFFTLNTQLNLWRIVYLLLFAFHLIIFRLIRVRPKEAKTEEAVNKISLKEKLSWFLLGSAGVMMFLSVTNIITYEITPAPLFWILPLCVYLISFVFNFKRSPWCPDWIKGNFHLIAAYGIFLIFLTQKRIVPIMIEFICHCALLFMVCMFCQSELNKRKPADSRSLTTFYLMISGGGFVGGLLVSWVIPLVSASMIEYLLGLFIIALVLTIEQKKRALDSHRLRLVVYALVLLIIWPVAFKGYNVFGIIMIIVLFGFIYAEFKNRPIMLCISLFIVLCCSAFIDFMWSPELYSYRHRNYYGIYKIYDKSGKRMLINGTTVHGGQYLIKEKEMDPITYYHPSTPVGRIMTTSLFNFKRIGVIGLGPGAIAAYGNSEQSFDFFELDPDVLKIADKYFTFLKKSPSKIKHIIGDARISLLKIPDNYYDLVVIDAFSGDSIPVHLLTTEAITGYMRTLTDEGILLFHISNRYVDIEPILFSNANALRLYACCAANRKTDQDPDAYTSFWFILTANARSFEKLTAQLKWSKTGFEGKVRKIHPWTDQYSNVLLVLKVEKLLSQITEFRPFYWDFSLTGD